MPGWVGGSTLSNLADQCAVVEARIALVDQALEQPHPQRRGRQVKAELRTELAGLTHILVQGRGPRARLEALMDRALPVYLEDSRAGEPA